jgi:hypothetical protein
VFVVRICSGVCNNRKDVILPCAQSQLPLQERSRMGSSMELNGGVASPSLKPALHCVQRLTSAPHRFNSGKYRTGARKDSRSGLNTVEREGVNSCLAENLTTTLQRSVPYHCADCVTLLTYWIRDFSTLLAFCTRVYAMIYQQYLHITLTKRIN